MRRTVIAIVCLLSPLSLLAAPVPAGRSSSAPATPAQLQQAARDYAMNLELVIDNIETNYVRSVDRAVLFEAALIGLYEAAQVPVPGNLHSAVRKATKETIPRVSDEGPMPVGRRYPPPTYPGVAPDLKDPLSQLAVKARLDVGNPESLQGRKALIASCRAMLRTLDPFCAVVTEDEAVIATGFDQNYGVGLDLVEKEGTGPLFIKAVVPGGPAQRVGLQAGDRITRIDDKETNMLSAREALERLNGGGAGRGDEPPPPVPPGTDLGSSTTAPPTPVRLLVRSAGDKDDRKVTLLRGAFEAETVQGVCRNRDNSWDYWVDPKKRIAHVRIVALARHTAEELARVLTRLDSGEGLGGLILDLRWCPGGYLTAATNSAELFLKDGVIAKTDIRTEGEHSYEVTPGERTHFLRFPIVVLVNGETTGGGELIAAALQDHKRAVVVGQRTRGKGSIQTPTRVMLWTEGRVNGTLELKLTNGTFLRPNGKGLTRFANSKPSDEWGIRPDADQEFRTSAELSKQLKEWWQQQSLRPGSSDKALPLDDPEQDPQRQAALKALRRIMAEKKDAPR